jgi:wyosine [tRNA(Phe)-imidazoG37] synthetase (radical SAM superfamily)
MSQSLAVPDIAFGPVPSRRLGRSLGINNIRAKVCTYSCAYCQVGRTVQLRWGRRPFREAAGVAAAVRRHLDAARQAGEPVDYLTFVPDGEPTLDRAIGEVIRLLRPLGVPVAVISNGSLLFDADVRAALAAADCVSVKVDTVRPETWRRLNRPHRRLALTAVLDGIGAFAAGFRGTLITETMLVDHVNDGEDELRHTAAFVGDLHPRTAYLAVPTRPPVERWAVPPGESVLARAYEVFRTWHPRVEMLLGYEGDAFASTGDPVADLLRITAVHPMREGAVHRLLERGGVPLRAVADLVAAGRLVEVRYGPHRYYLRPVGRWPAGSFAGDSGA